MKALPDDELDKGKVAYFIQRYSAVDSDELVSLDDRRATLADEAIVALDEVLTQRGVSPTMLRRLSASASATTYGLPKPLNADLGKSLLAKVCVVASIAAVSGPVVTYLRMMEGPILNIGSSPGAAFANSVIAGLSVGAIAFAGGWAAARFVRSVSRTSGASMREKRVSLWLMLAATLCLWAVLHGLIALILTGTVSR